MQWLVRPTFPLSLFSISLDNSLIHRFAKGLPSGNPFFYAFKDLLMLAFLLDEFYLVALPWSWLRYGNDSQNGLMLWKLSFNGAAVCWHDKCY